MVWTNYDGLESPMLHTKFRGNRPVGSGEDFWRVLTIYGRGGHLGHVTQMPRTKFRSPYLRRLHIKFGFDRPSGFGEEDVWNCLRRTDGRTTTDNGGTPDHEYPISSPMSLWLRWAKNALLNSENLVAAMWMINSDVISFRDLHFTC